MRLKIGFTGTGYISKIHASVAQTLPDVELVAVVNHRTRSMDAFAEEFNITRQYATIEELLKDGDVDAIIINTPNYLHAPEAIAALESGVHVMVEKPMAMNSVDAEAMLAASEKSGALLMVAHCWRFDTEVSWLKEQIYRIGPIIRTKGYGVHVNWGPSGWFTQKELAGGGALVDMGIHALDTVRFLLGDPQPVSVYARLGTFYKKFEVDDTGVIVVNWDNDTISYIESGWWQPHADGAEAGTQLYGAKGFASLFPTYLKYSDLQNETLNSLDPDFPHPRPDHCQRDMYINQMAYFVDCIRNERIPVPGGSEGLINMKVIDAAYESSGAGQVMEIP